MLNGKLDPPFSPNVTNYSALFVGDTYLRVTPHIAEAGAGVSVNTPQASGVQSDAISLSPEENMRGNFGDVGSQSAFSL